MLLGYAAPNTFKDCSSAVRQRDLSDLVGFGTLPRSSPVSAEAEVVGVITASGVRGT